MKKFVLPLFFAAFASCNNQGGEGATTRSDSGRLSTNMVSNPHTAEGMDATAMAEKPTMDFSDSTHDFGNIKEGEVVTHDFEFTNHGKTPLIIASAIGSCGCTVPEYPHDPIAPGRSGIMKVSFNSAGKMGHQEKSVTINSNAARGVQMIGIKAEVAEKK